MSVGGTPYDGCVGGLVGVGLGLGVLLPGLVPAINIGMGTLIGVVAFGFCLQFVGRLLFFSDLSLEEEEEPPPASWTASPRVESYRGPATATAEALVRA